MHSHKVLKKNLVDGGLGGLLLSCSTIPLCFEKRVLYKELFLFHFYSPMQCSRMNGAQGEEEY